MEAHLGELDPPSSSHEEERRDAGRIVAARHIQVDVQEHRKAHVIGFHQLLCLLATVLRNRHDPITVGAKRLGQALQIGDREAAGGTVGLDERDQQWISCRRRESPICSVQSGQ